MPLFFTLILTKGNFRSFENKEKQETEETHFFLCMEKAHLLQTRLLVFVFEKKCELMQL